MLYEESKEYWSRIYLLRIVGEYVKLPLKLKHKHFIDYDMFEKVEEIDIEESWCMLEQIIAIEEGWV